jgi:hypothetical protein
MGSTAIRALADALRANDCLHEIDLKGTASWMSGCVARSCVCMCVSVCRSCVRLFACVCDGCLSMTNACRQRGVSVRR